MHEKKITKNNLYHFFKSVGLCLISLCIMTAAIALGFAGLFTPKNVEETLRPNASSLFLDDAGEVIFSALSAERRIPVELNIVPRHVQDCFIAIEDNRFYEHEGIDYRATLRAIIMTLSGREIQGGSTITQQLAKNAFLTQERTLLRKIREAYIAFELERQFTKPEILEMYLNQIYFGYGVYGIESAAHMYFDKSVQELTLPEAAMLAAIPKAPNYYNPFINFAASKERQELVLDQMEKYGYLTAEETASAKTTEIKPCETHKTQEIDLRSYFFDMCGQKVMEEFDADALYKGGLKIYTTLNTKMQEEAEKSMKQHLPDFYEDDNHKHQPQCAIVAIDPKTGEVKAMIGGRGDDKFNRSILAVRQPGSSFKPFVYVTAMQNGYTPASIIEDKEEEFAKDWKPQNVTKKFYGKVSLRTALKRSMNVATIHLAKNIGPYKIVQNAEKMGITTLIDSGKYTDVNLAMAIGGLTNGVTPIEMASAYSVFANNGIYSRPYAIKKIEDRDGNIIYEYKPTSRAVMDEKAVYMTVDILRDVLISGSGSGMGIGRPAAGKTGTTDDSVDAWFIGFTPDLCTAVWVGDDNNRPLKEKEDSYAISGNGTPLAIWHTFMYNALKELPKADFINPGVVIPPEPVIIQNTEKTKQETSVKIQLSPTEEKRKHKRLKNDLINDGVKKDFNIIESLPQKKSVRDRMKE
ncbi:MAG: PBP1A family penicillin-binding protein, partial [Phascolarctobacterium sp.]|nr:PBP1A family penicillin-binding protein [Candidatus Phascolarctobacterium caballi]